MSASLLFDATSREHASAAAATLARGRGVALHDVSMSFDGLACLRLSPRCGDAPPLAFDLVVDAASGAAFLCGAAAPPHARAWADLLAHACEALAALPPRTTNTPLSFTELLRLLGAAARVTPPPPPPRSLPPGPTLAAATSEALAALCLTPEVLNAWGLQPDAAPRRLAAVLLGACASLALAANACLRNPRYADVLEPSPPRWVLEAAAIGVLQRGGEDATKSSGSGDAEGGEGPDTATATQAAFSAALGSLPPALLQRLLAAIAVEASSAASASQAALPSLPSLLCAALSSPLFAPALPLLYWAAVLAPSRLLALPPCLPLQSAPSSSSATLPPPPPVLTFAVVTGPWSTAAAAAAATAAQPAASPAPATGVLSGSLPHAALSALATQLAAFARAPTSMLAAAPPPPPPSAAAARPHALLPAWDGVAAAAHGTLRGGPFYHGTASDNAHCLLHRGPAVHSGTRRERTGAMYGPGVYLSNAPEVALGFARGAGWGAPQLVLPLEAGAAAARGQGEAPATAPFPWAPVFEFEVVAAPDVEVWREGAQLPHSAVASTGAPPASYLVVPSPRCCHVTRLHLAYLPPASSSSAAPFAAAKEAATGASGRREEETTGNGADTRGRPCGELSALQLLSGVAVVAALLAAAVAAP